MSHSKENRNYMKELKDIFCHLRSTKMEPECCNISCPPLGCPRGPCPGMCLDERCLPDPCCYSEMPNPCSSSTPTTQSCPKHRKGSSCNRH